MIKQYRKKPVVIEAVRLDGTLQNAEQIMHWMKEVRYGCGKQTNGFHFDIHTLEGVMHANPGDWIIKGVKGEFYPCADEIFRLTYDEA